MIKRPDHADCGAVPNFEDRSVIYVEHPRLDPHRMQAPKPGQHEGFECPDG